MVYSDCLLLVLGQRKDVDRNLPQSRGFFLEMERWREFVPPLSGAGELVLEPVPECHLEASRLMSRLSLTF